MKLLIRWFTAALLLAAGLPAMAQQAPLPCVAGSPSQKIDEAVWKKVREIDHAVVYARYARMLMAVRVVVVVKTNRVHVAGVIQFIGIAAVETQVVPDRAVDDARSDGIAHFQRHLHHRENGEAEFPDERDQR